MGVEEEVWGKNGSPTQPITEYEECKLALGDLRLYSPNQLMV